MKILAALLGSIAPGMLTAALAAPPPPASCVARSSDSAATLVELYTSEGCSSCPPADRWLSTQSARPGVVAVAWHVDYWDRLGWRDRFANAEATRRQTAQLEVNGARFAYTPQVVVDGRDTPRWPGTEPSAAKRAATVSVSLQREGAQVLARIEPGPGAPPRLAAWWALLEDGHTSVVRAGENDGATLHHDAVARVRADVPAWTAGPQPRSLAWTPPACDAKATACRVALVVLDAASGRPVQAVATRC